MDGPRHYREAVRALQRAHSGEAGDPYCIISEAKAHANLALAAAQVDLGHRDEWEEIVATGWGYYEEAERVLGLARSGQVRDPYCAMATADVLATLVLVVASVDVGHVQEWAEVTA